MAAKAKRRLPRRPVETPPVDPYSLRPALIVAQALCKEDTVGFLAGSRVLEVFVANGREAIVRAAGSDKTCVPMSSFKLDRVFHWQHRVNPDNGWLEIRKLPRLPPSFESERGVEEAWIPFSPWSIYDPAIKIKPSERRKEKAKPKNGEFDLHDGF